MKPSKEIKIGNIAIGAGNDIAIQSMTNTDTNDIEKTLGQIVSLIDSDCQIVRVTTPSLREAEALVKIHQKLREMGHQTPIVADVHFNPKVAEFMSQYVEKVRINPGNYVDKKLNKTLEYTPKEYQAELDKIEERLLPLMELCKQHNTAIRIGVNHGSLSDRIISQYGNTAQGMAMSGIEFADIMQRHNFTNLVMSLKSSDVKTMIKATQLFVEMMKDRKMSYPLHLGVTEAGSESEARIKSAAGIGALLISGIGDTIRVSLTEKPENEIPVAHLIVEISEKIINESGDFIPYKTEEKYSRIKTTEKWAIGGGLPLAIISNCAENRADKSVDFIETNIEDFNILKIEGGRSLREFHENISEIVSQDSRPLIVKRTYQIADADEFMLRASIEFSGILSQGLCDAIWIENPHFDDKFNYQLSNEILQAMDLRRFKAEIVSCPSCGRTLYDIEKLLKAVKAEFSHHKGLKIGVMGCVVNGPGEMADADYGIVGAGNGKVWIFKAGKAILKNIPEEEAIATLKSIIEVES